MAISVANMVLGSDAETVIKELSEGKRQPIKRLEGRREDYKAELSAYGQLKAKLNDLDSALNDMSGVGTLSNFSAKSGKPELLTAQARQGAKPDFYTIGVKQLAKAEKMKSKETFKGGEDVYPFIIDENNNEIKINFREKEDSKLSKKAITATIKQGTYKTARLANAVKEALEEALGNHYEGDCSVSYDKSAKGFVIKGPEELEELQLLWSDPGSSAAATLGFDPVDDIGGTRYVSDNPPGKEIVLEIKVGDDTTSVSLFPSETDSIADVAEAINKSGALKAGVFNVGQKSNGERQYTLTLSVKDIGEANTIKGLTVEYKQDDDGTESPGIPEAIALKRLAIEEPEERKTNKKTELPELKNFKWTQNASDSIISVNGVEIYKDTNKMDDVIENVTITLESPPDPEDLDEYGYSEATLKIGGDIEALEGKITHLVEAYNDALTFLKESKSYDAETKEEGPLLGDFMTNTVQNSLADLAGRPVLDAGRYRYLFDLGATLQEDGQLDVDSSRLNKAVNDDFEGVLDFLVNADDAFVPRMRAFLDGTLDPRKGSLVSIENRTEDSIEQAAFDLERLEKDFSEWESRTKREFEGLQALQMEYEMSKNYMDMQTESMQNLSRMISGR